ncbi:translocation and assembly module lipoprotein TamL [Neolewinella persica]|uniref:translocation and assembly module lipoprotein TamL n=1 Tax=Neolewinella persica TaxID=70998 RepID=UPI00035D176E|nr:BamA/TamA family outer membrane protein [Neolewinella persica]
MNLMVPELMGILKRGWRPAGAGVWYVALLLTVLASSCNTTKFLAEDQELLTSYRIKLADPKNVTKRADVAYELSTLARQQPNGNFLAFWPREQFYLDNNKPKDTTRIDRFLRNTLGQPPTIYSDSLSRISTTDMKDYLLKLGYLRATVYHEADRGKRRKVDLIYHVEAGKRFAIDSVEFTSPDPQVDSLLQLSKTESELQPGAPLDLNLFDKEKARISTYFRNKGFAFFSGSYFDKLEVDTNRQSGLADVYLSILPAEREAAYDRYRVGSITVLTDFSPVSPGGGYRLDTTINGVRFLSNEPSFRMRPELLRKSVFLTSGEFLRYSDLEKTNLSMNALGIYRFVRINQQIDTLDPGILNYQVQLTPSDRMSLGADLDLNYTNRNGNVGAGNLIGVSLTPSFQNRNVFGGAELLVTSLRAGVELNPRVKRRNTAFFNTIDLSADVSLYLPRFQDFGVYNFLNKIPSPFGSRIVSDDFLNQLRERASTRYSLGYEYLSIQRFYAYTLLNARLGYDFKRSATTNYRINNLAIDVLAPTIEREFEIILQQNEFLRRSIGEQYFFSLFFRDLEYTRSGRVDRRGRSLSFNGQLELAGAEVSLFNDALNLFSENNRIITPKEGATFAKYALALADIRYQKQYNPLKSFAARFLVAAGRPYGGSEAVPYVKQFFAGGANSMRAWAPRGLGPGGFVDTLSLSTNNNLQLFQTGDFRLELNLEYRFNIASFFRGAFFADIGNIWTFEEDPERPGSQFLLSKRANEAGTFVNQAFYRQLAMSAGTGLRTDLSYFLFRLDVSLPLRYNYPQDGFGEPLDRDGTSFGESTYWRSFSSFRFRDLTFQLGLGYPF